MSKTLSARRFDSN